MKRVTSRLYNWCTARVDRGPWIRLQQWVQAPACGRRGSPSSSTGSSTDISRCWRRGPVPPWPRYRCATGPRHGKSKYGLNRFWRGLLDLLTVKFLTTYDTRPFHLIGGLGLAVLTGGVALLIWMLVERLSGATVGDRPALLAGITLAVVGVQLVSVGLLAELIVALYRRSRRESIGDNMVGSSSRTSRRRRRADLIAQATNDTIVPHEVDPEFGSSTGATAAKPRARSTSASVAPRTPIAP